MTSLWRAAVVYLTLGLAGGLGYRTLTHAQDFEGTTQLAVVHTHLLVLGFLVMLVLLLLDRTIGLGTHRTFRVGLGVYHAGMALSAGMMVLKGALTVLGTWTDRPMWAGIAGLGHVLLTVGLALFMLALRRSLAGRAPAAATSPASALRA